MDIKEKQMKKLLLATVIGGLSTAAAADYRAELTANYRSIESTLDNTYSRDTYDETAYQFAGAFFFDSVSTDSVPVDEASFLSKNSSVSAYNQVKHEEYKRQETYNGFDYGYEGRYHYRQTGIGYRGVFGKGIFNVDLVQGYSNGDSGARMISIGGGAYLTDSSALTGRIIKFTNSGDNDAGLGINYRHVFNAKGDTSYLLDADFFAIDDYTLATLEGAVFFTPSSKLFVNYIRAATSDDDFDANIDELGIGYQHFFMNRIGLTARYANGDYNSLIDEKESYLDFELQINI